MSTQGVATNTVEWEVEETRRDLAEFSMSDGSRFNPKTRPGCVRYDSTGDVQVRSTNIESSYVPAAGVLAIESNTYPSAILSGNYLLGPVWGDLNGASVPAGSFVLQSDGQLIGRTISLSGNSQGDGVWLITLNVTWPAGTFSAGTHTISVTDGSQTWTQSTTSHLTTEPVSLHLSGMTFNTTAVTLTPTITPLPTASTASVHFSVIKLSNFDANAISDHTA